MARNLSLDILDDIRVASPCSMDWEPMTGDERTRHCEQCGLHVHNLDAMTRDEALALAQGASQGGRVCVRFYRRADGKVLTRDCPVGLAAVRAKARHAYSRVAALLALLLSGAWLVAKGDANAGALSDAQPFSTLRAWLRPAPPQRMMIMGDICLPTPPQQLGGTGGLGLDDQREPAPDAREFSPWPRQDAEH